MSLLHRQERAVQRAARNVGRGVAVVWQHGDRRLKVKARPRLIGFEMKYWEMVRGIEVKLTRKEAVELSA